MRDTADAAGATRQLGPHAIPPGRSRLPSGIVGQHLAERNLARLPSGERLIALSMITASGFAMLAITMAILGVGPLNQPMSHRARAVTGVVLYVALMASLAVVAGSGHASKEQGGLGVLSRVGVRLLPAAGMAFIAFTILVMDEDQRTSPRLEWGIIRAVAWAALGVACVYVLRPAPNRSHGLVDANRALRVVVPALLWVAVLGVTKAMGIYSMGISALVYPALLVLALVAVALAIGMTITGALAALERTRQRGQAVADYIGARRRRIFGVLLAKFVALFAVWAAYHFFRPDEPVIVLTRTAIVMASVAAMVAIVLFALDSRIHLLASDHTKVARYGGFLVGGAVGTGLAVVITVAVMATIITVRWAYVIGVLALIAFGIVYRRFRRRAAVVLGYPVAVILAVTISAALGHGERVENPVIDPKNESTLQVLTVLASLIAVVVFLGAAVWVLVLAISRRRFGWLTYVITVVIWNVVVSWWNSVSTLEFMNFDIALTLLMTGAGVLLVLGVQRVIDGFEIVVAVAVTFLLIEGPKIVDLLPEELALIPVVFAVVGPGVTIAWKASAVLSQAPAHGNAMLHLATTCLVYCGIAAVFWHIDFDVPDYLRTVSDFSLSVLAIPLLLILVAAHNPSRRQPVGQA